MRPSGVRIEGAENIEALRLLGGRSCLDFANTVDPRYGDHPREYLGRYEDLVAWGRHAGVLGEEEARTLLGEAAANPSATEDVFRQALELREAIYRVFLAIARSERPAPDDIMRLGEWHLRAMARSKIVPTVSGYAWALREREDALERPLWPVARSASELLTSGDLARVRECPGSGDCGWLFYDSSKNGSRRWCSMAGCGSRVKMRRMYARQRGKGPTDP